MRRGDIWWASLPEPAGSEPAYRRPVLIIQANAFNMSNINTVIVVALTTNLKLANAPGNLLITAQHSHLSLDSVINISQIITIDKQFLTDYVGSISAKLLNQVENGVRLILAL